MDQAASADFGGFSRWRTNRLVNENVENTLANFTSVKMMFLPFVLLKPSRREVEQPAIFDVQFD